MCQIWLNSVQGLWRLFFSKWKMYICLSFWPPSPREGKVLLRDTFPCPRFSKKRKHIYTIFVVTLFFAKKMALGFNRFACLILFLSSVEILLRPWLNFGKVNSPYFFLHLGRAWLLIKTNLSFFYTRILWAMFVWK